MIQIENDLAQDILNYISDSPTGSIPYKDVANLAQRIMGSKKVEDTPDKKPDEKL